MRIQVALPVAAVVLLALGFFYQLVLTDRILARGDTFAYFYPYWDARDDALRQGELPLWTPELFMGAPLLANPQVGTLYPPNWLTVPLDAPNAVKVSILLHVIWAALGTMLLARASLRLDWPAALVGGAIYGFGGYLGAHVEQINQLQGLAWMPWLFLLLDRTLTSPRLYLPLLAVAWALQLLSGHTQTVFIAGIGLGVYAVSRILGDRKTYKRRPRNLLLALVLLAVAGLSALLIASPQLLPAQDAAALSNRGDGLTQHEATAFSLNPVLIGRGLLPSYDGQPFGEYISYLGVAGLGLMMVGIFAPVQRRWAWIVLLVIGFAFALGRFNPLYWWLASLPGFNLFRVPARWLALFALAAAMLAALGVQQFRAPASRRERWALLFTIVLVTGLAASTLLADRAAAEVDGPAVPTAVTWLGWALALFGFTSMMLLRQIRRTQLWLRWVPGAVVILVLAELWLASSNLPYNDLTDPSVYNDARFAASQMRAYTTEQNPPGRLLSITDLLFDPGDRASLEARWDQLGISERAARYAFTATKMQEVVAANLPLTWGISSVDGFGGGLLPTSFYTAFTSLLLPEATPRTLDGRLREVLAQPACRGACLPEDRWVDLTNTHYLLTDKVYDLNHDDVFYDTQFQMDLVANEQVELPNPGDFEADTLDLLVRCTDACDLDAVLQTDEGSHNLFTAPGETPMLDGWARLRLRGDTAVAPNFVVIQANRPLTIRAASLVDSRTGDFVQLTPPDWRRLYSADIKIYENLDVLPRAFVVQEAYVVPDTWHGSEDALALMDDPSFDPSRTVVLNADAEGLAMDPVEADSSSSAVITAYTPTRVVVEATLEHPGYLLLTDAYFTGWHAEDLTRGENLPIYRANVMFRAVRLPAGATTVEFSYSPFGLPSWAFALLMMGGLTLAAAVGFAMRDLRLVGAAQGDGTRP